MPSTKQTTGGAHCTARGFLPVLQIVCVLHGPFRFVQRLARIAAAGVRPAGRLQHNGPHRWVLDARGSVPLGLRVLFHTVLPPAFCI